MKRLYHPFLIFKILLLFLLTSLAVKTHAQGATCGTAASITVANITNPASDADITCNIPTTTPGNELWWSLPFSGDASFVGKTILVEFSNGGADDIKLEVFTGCPGTLANIEASSEASVSTKRVGKVTERVSFVVTSGQNYFIKVSRTGAAGSVSGHLCIKEGQPLVDYDLARNALPITVGTCNFNFEVNVAYINHEEASLPAAVPAVTPKSDAWVVFNPDDGGYLTGDRIGFSYKSLDKNAALFVYRSANGDGTDLQAVDVNLLTGVHGVNDNNINMPVDGDSEVVEFEIANTAGDDKYFIRIVNLEAGTMTGKGCLYEVYARDNCAVAKKLPTNACDIPVNIFPNNTISSTAAISCSGGAISPSDRDIFLKYRTSATTTALTVSLNAPDANHRLIIYSSCASVATTDLICAGISNATPGGATAIPSLAVTGNTEYIIRVVSVGNQLQGKLCVIEGENVLSNACSASSLTVSTGSVGCNFKNATLLPTFSALGNIKNCITHPNPVLPSYISTTAQDGWVKLTGFTVGKEVTVVYDNNNGSATVAPDVELQLFSTPAGCPQNVPTTTSIVCANNVIGEGIEQFTFIPMSGNDYYVRVSNMEAISSTPGLIRPVVPGKICAFEQTLLTGDICTNAISVNVGDCVLDLSWAPGEYFNNPAFTSGGSQSGCSAPGAGSEDAWVTFTATSTKTTIEFQERDGRAAYLEVYRGSCNSLNKVTISGSTYCESVISGQNAAELNLTTIPSETYFVRVVSLDAIPLKGRLCLYETIAQDVCDDVSLVTKYVGACNLRFSIPADFSNNGATHNTQGGAPARPDAATYTACPGIDGADRDAYMRFLGNGREVTIQYESLDVFPVTAANADNEADDPAIVVYTRVLGKGPVDCGIGINGAGNFGNEYICADDVTVASKQTETVTFKTESGRLYIVRILDKNAGKMRGTLCITEGTVEHNQCANALDINHVTKQGIDEGVGECNRQLSIIANGGDNTFTVSGPSFISDGTPEPTVNNTCAGSPILPVGSDLKGFEAGDFVQFEATDPEMSIAYYNFTGGPVSITVRRVCGGAIETGTTTTGTNRVTLSLTGLTIGNTYVVTVSGSTGGERRLTIYQTDLGPPADAWATFTTKLPSVLGFTPAPIISVQYDNDNGNFVVPAQDVVLEVYQGTDCNSLVKPTTSNAGASKVRADDLQGADKEGIEQVTFDTDLTTNQTFRVRVVQKHTAGGSTYGKVCTFYGQTIASRYCHEATTYVPLKGQWQGFDVQGDWAYPNRNSNGNPFGTSITTPPCIIPNKGRPVAPYTNPIRKEGWVKFTVPSNADYDRVTVQYDNAGFNNGSNPANAAIAVYAAPNKADKAIVNGGTCSAAPCAICTPYYPNNTEYVDGNPANNIDGLFFIGCSNSVWEGKETFTLYIEPGITYWVRVMNVSATEGVMRGRIRVYPYVDCTLGSNLATDPDFANWRKIQRNASDKISTGTGWYYDGTPSQLPDYDPVSNGAEEPNQGKYIHSNPNVLKNLPSDIGNISELDYFQLFATEYGYSIDSWRGVPPSTPASNRRTTSSQYRYLMDIRWGLNPEGNFAVAHSPWSLKGDWSGYGLGHTGYGRNTNPHYCTNVSLGKGQEPCIGYGSDPVYAGNTQKYDYGTRGDKSGAKKVHFPAPIPTAADANFLIVNGWWNRTSGYVNSGKVWCQTIEGLNSSNVEYFVFSAYFQNMIQISRNLDVPQMRFTICDMAHPEAENPTDPSAAPSTPGKPTYTIPALRGTTTFVNDSNAPEGTLGKRAVHSPRPRKSGYRRYAAPNQGYYGAAMPCNVAGEDKDMRIKVLGSDFFINESPDKWVIVKCIYRKPKGVDKLNICIENLSLTKNGNDFGVDRISFQQCTNLSGIDERMEQLLRGDACELSDNPDKIGIPLGVDILEFSGFYNGKNTLLSWSTLSEENVKKYVIERSTNGKDFYKIGEVKSKGNSKSLLTYNYTDMKVPTGGKYVYYRMFIMGINGDNKTSGVVRVEIPQFDEKLTISPNPVDKDGNVELTFTSSQGNATLTVSDIMGNRLMNKEIQLKSGLNNIELSTQGLKSGVYIININKDGKRVSGKLVIY